MITEKSALSLLIIDFRGVVCAKYWTTKDKRVKGQVDGGQEVKDSFRTWSSGQGTK